MSPSLVGVLHTSARLVYRTLDLGLLSNDQIWGLAAAGLAAGGVSAVLVARRSGRRPAAIAAAAVAVPLLAPALALGLAPAIAWFTRVVHIPVHDPIYGFHLNRDANEDSSAFGAAGALALFAAPILAFRARRSDRRLLVFALAAPSYVLLLGLYAKYNIWLTRFLIVPAVLTAPLYGWFFTRRAAALALIVVAGWTVFYTLEGDDSKPLVGATIARPWQLTQADALAESPAEPMGRRAAAGLRAYQRIVPPSACVGAVLDPDEWSYPLWGPRLQHRILFLPSLTALATAYRENVPYVVVSSGANAPVASQFGAAGWKLVSLAHYWTLAVAPHVRPGGCQA